MKNKLFLSLIAISFSSCTSIYYFHTAADPNIKIEQSMYVYENDTIQIVYDFWTNCGKMSFTVYNKLNIPIFIDWKNSALIVNDNKNVYYVEMETRNGNSVRVSYNGVTSGFEKSVAVKNERVTSVPPRTRIKKELAPLRKNVSPKKEGYTLVFRNFLAFSTYEEVKSDVYIDNGFHVTNVEHLKGKQLKKLPKTNPMDFFTNLQSKIK